MDIDIRPILRSDTPQRVLLRFVERDKTRRRTYYITTGRPILTDCPVTQDAHLCAVYRANISAAIGGNEGETLSMVESDCELVVN